MQHTYVRRWCLSHTMCTCTYLSLGPAWRLNGSRSQTFAGEQHARRIKKRLFVADVAQLVSRIGVFVLVLGSSSWAPTQGAHTQQAVRALAALPRDERRAAAFTVPLRVFNYFSGSTRAGHGSNVRDTHVGATVCAHTHIPGSL